MWLTINNAWLAVDIILLLIGCRYFWLAHKNNKMEATIVLIYAAIGVMCVGVAALSEMFRG